MSGQQTSTDAEFFGFFPGGEKALREGEEPRSVFYSTDGEVFKCLYLNSGHVDILRRYEMREGKHLRILWERFTGAILRAWNDIEKSNDFLGSIFFKLLSDADMLTKAQREAGARLRSSDNGNFRVEVHASTDGKNLRVRKIPKWQLKPRFSFANKKEKQKYLADVRKHLKEFEDEVERLEQRLQNKIDLSKKTDIISRLSALRKTIAACQSELLKWDPTYEPNARTSVGLSESGESRSGSKVSENAVAANGGDREISGWRARCTTSLRKASQELEERMDDIMREFPILFPKASDLYDENMQYYSKARWLIGQFCEIRELRKKILELMKRPGEIN